MRQYIQCTGCITKNDCFFSDLKPEALEELKRIRIINSIKKGEVIFSERQTPKGIYIVCSGRVKIYKLTRSGQQLTTRLAGPGDILGYRSLIANEEYSANAEALENSQLSFIYKDAFFPFTSRFYPVTLKLLKKLGEDLRSAENKARDIAYKSARERIGDLLFMLDSAYSLKNRKVRYPISLKRQELAEMAGITTETAIRVLREFNKQKIIELKGRSITISNESKLRAAAGFLT